MFKHCGWIAVFALMNFFFAGCGSSGGGASSGASTPPAPPAPVTLLDKYEGIYRIAGSGFDISISASGDTDGSVHINFNGPVWDDVFFYRIEGAGATSTGGRIVYLNTVSGIKQIRISGTTYTLNYISG